MRWVLLYLRLNVLSLSPPYAATLGNRSSTCVERMPMYIPARNIANYAHPAPGARQILLLFSTRIWFGLLRGPLYSDH